VKLLSVFDVTFYVQFAFIMHVITEIRECGDECSVKEYTMKIHKETKALHVITAST